MRLHVTIPIIKLKLSNDLFTTNEKYYDRANMVWIHQFKQVLYDGVKFKSMFLADLLYAFN